MRKANNFVNRKKQNEKFIPQIPIKEQANLAPKTRKHESLIIFLIALALNVVVAVLFSFVWHIGEVDALTTTANGYPDPLHAPTGHRHGNYGSGAPLIHSPVGVHPIAETG